MKTWIVRTTPENDVIEQLEEKEMLKQGYD